MSRLDDIFNNPYPGYNCDRRLLGLYVSDTLLAAQHAHLTEDELIEKITSVSGYLEFLNCLNNLVVQEISDLSDQYYGPLESN